MVRDLRSGTVQSADDWVSLHMQREGRDRNECLDELVNAIARGDLVAES
jgi:hypothetical protein